MWKKVLIKAHCMYTACWHWQKYCLELLLWKRSVMHVLSGSMTSSLPFLNWMRCIGKMKWKEKLKVRAWCCLHLGLLINWWLIFQRWSSSKILVEFGTVLQVFSHYYPLLKLIQPVSLLGLSTFFFVFSGCLSDCLQHIFCKDSGKKTKQTNTVVSGDNSYLLGGQIIHVILGRICTVQDKWYWFM